MIWNGLVNTWNTLSGMLAKVWEGLTSVGQWIWNGILQFSDLVQRVFQDIGNRVMGALSTIGSAISSFGKMLVDGFTTVTRMITDFAKIFDKWATALMGGLSTIGNAFGQFLQTIANLPQTLQNIFSGIVDFFTRIGEAIANFTRDPAKWFKEHVIDPIWKGMVWLAQKIWEGLQTVWQHIVKGFSWLVDALKGVGEAIWNALVGFASWLASGVQSIAISFINAVKGVASAFSDAIVGFLKSLLLPHSPSTIDIAGQIVKENLQEVMRILHPKPPVALTPEKLVMAWRNSMITMGIFYVFTRGVEAIFRAIKNISQAAKELGLVARTVTFTLGVPGTNIMLEIDIPGPVLRALGIVGDEIGRFGERFSDPLWMGLSFWYARAMMPILMYELRNYLPIEVPTFRESEDMWNRVWSAKLALEGRGAMIPSELGDTVYAVLESIKYFMKVRGYSDYLLKLAFADENEFYIKVKDRFQKDRVIPLADAWKIPSPSDLVTMMIRDVFWEFKDFEVAMRVHGFNKDTAILYYYLHYRYPSPEKLGEFFWRGVAGVLWYPDSMMEEPIATALGLPGLQAKAPKDLNFQFKDLRDAIYKYMKWHDYAPFPWIPGFTTDKAIITELMADLPDKVDFRWKLRWGIFEHLSKLGIGLATPIDQLVPKLASASGKELVSEAVSPEISLDVSLLARFLVAKGVHPYFVAISAVAEAHTMLTDEMTLLRTGFLELYRWGMANVNQLEKLMSGLFVVKFTTAYLDLEAGKWQPITYNKPVLWLPAERRLLQLRSVMDRYYMLFRDFVREVERGVRFLALHTERTVEEIKKYVSGLKLDKETSEVVSRSIEILESYKKADELIIEYGSVVTDMLSKEVKAISGVDIRFTLDDKYIETWIRAAELTRDIESRTWIRHYATRLVAWIIYRTSYGWTPVEKFKNLTAILMARGWLTIEEKEFLDTVAEWVYGIVRREMIPTPIQLATFSEYMKVQDEVIDKVLEEHRVPDEYRHLYKQYIAFRFIKSDFRAYLNRARRAYVLGIINDEEWGRVIKEAVDKYGFRQEEIEIMKRLAELEELMESVRVWRPSLTTIATISEVVPIPREAMDKILERFRVDPLIKPYVIEYVKRRPLLDELRLLVNEYYRMKYYSAVYKQTIPQDIEQAVQKYAQLFGLTEEEKAIRDMVARMRETVEMWRDSVREYVPTPSMLATIYEYVPTLTDEDINRVLDARNVPAEWRKIWVEYIKRRAISDDARALISAYFSLIRYAARYGQKVPDEIAKAVQTHMQLVGFSKEEIAIRQMVAQIYELIESWRESAREYIPTPSMLATIYEYVPSLTDDMIVKVLEARNVPAEWRNIWISYIKNRAIADDVRALISSFYRMKRYASMYGYAVPEDIAKAVEVYMAKIGFTEEEKSIRDLITLIEVTIEYWRESAREYIPTPTMLATIYEYVPTLTDKDIIDVLKARHVPDKWINIWLRYIKSRALADDVRSLVSAYLSLVRYATRYGQKVPDDITKAVQSYMQMIGFSKEEIEVRQLIATIYEMIENWRENAREYIPTPSMLATIAEYVPSITDEMINKVLEARRVPQEWRSIWVQYIKARPLADEVRRLLNTFYRMKRYAMLYGYSVPKDVEDVVMRYATMIGVTDVEKSIRDLAVQIEATVDEWRELARRGETIPTLSQLVAMAEYINVPVDYVKKVIEARRVEPTYASLWLQYLYARTISGEVNRVVSAFEAIYTRFSVPEEVVSRVTSLMAQGGWTEQELKIFSFELELRRAYRVLVMLIPTIRQFIADALYLSDYERLFQDLLQVYAIDAEKYKKQVEYYKRLLKNRRLWRHFSWYRTQLTYAYMYGAMDEKQIMQKLQQFANLGLIDEDELSVIIDGIKIRALAYVAYQARRRR
jgi:antitoxin component HigA of HigAB toxin-antitoxin module